MPCEAAANVTWTAPQEGRVFRQDNSIGKLRNDPGKIRRWYHRIKHHHIVVAALHCTGVGIRVAAPEVSNSSFRMGPSSESSDLFGERLVLSVWSPF